MAVISDPTFESAVTALPVEDRNWVEAMKKKYFQRSGKPRVLVSGFPAKVFTLNLKIRDKVNDEYFSNLVEHVSEFKFHDDVAFALALKNSEEHQEIFKFFGYSIFAGYSDVELAKNWKFSVKNITAIRKLFFDFSNAPREVVGQLAYLRQLSSTGIIDEHDFKIYRRICELGKLGLRSMSNFFKLSKEEKSEVKQYLSDAVYGNTLDLGFTAVGFEQAVTYNRVVSNVAALHLREKEIMLTDARIRNLEASTEKMRAGIKSTDDLNLSDLDITAKELLREMSKRNDVFTNFKTLAELKTLETPEQ